MAESSLTQSAAFDNALQAENTGNPRRWAILAVLSAVAFMAQLDFFIVTDRHGLARCWLPAWVP